MLETILNEIITELKKRYPEAGVIGTTKFNIYRVGMVQLLVTSNSVDVKSIFMSLNGDGFRFDDGVLISYDLPNAIELVINHFGLA